MPFPTFSKGLIKMSGQAWAHMVTRRMLLTLLNSFEVKSLLEGTFSRQRTVSWLKKTPDTIFWCSLPWSFTRCDPFHFVFTSDWNGKFMVCCWSGFKANRRNKTDHCVNEHEKLSKEIVSEVVCILFHGHFSFWKEDSCPCVSFELSKSWTWCWNGMLKAGN